ncbi:MAG: nitrogenase [Deltaproteobacteria bacterium]|nr:nitrogenase [Deltaproteobacteria bacterium]
MKVAKATKAAYVSTTNACKLCKPLGACLVFRGIEGAVPFLHGSQGCATYMRRYLISHFREPVDIASSSLGEKHAVFGGGPNLKQGLRNVIAKYRPRLVGVASTCLTETIGDDVPHLLKEFQAEAAGAGVDGPEIVSVSTPSYAGTHMEGFHAAVRGLVDQLARGREPTGAVNLLPGFVSPADLRHLKDLLSDFGLPGTVLPDYSETLDGPALEEYPLIPEGGTPLEAIRGMGGALATVELGHTLAGPGSAGALLAERHGVPLRRLGTPIGLRETDRLFEALEELSGRPTPRSHALERGRLVDAYVDGHKYVFGKKAVVFGEEDLVVGLASFLAEIGVRPVLCASGGKSGRLEEAVWNVTEGLLPDPPQVREGVDFYEIEAALEALGPDLLIGHSKGYSLSKKRGIPLLRVGFPLHDRFGGQRLLHLGYRGTQALYDTLVNALLAVKQEGSQVGYGYL